MVGYVVMPEHVHLLLSEPQRATLATALKALKQSMARRVLKRHRRPAEQSELFAAERASHFWQARYYDFNVWPAKKRVEIALSAPQPGEARPGREARTVAVEQLSRLFLRRERAGETERELCAELGQGHSSWCASSHTRSACVGHPSVNSSVTWATRRKPRRVGHPRSGKSIVNQSQSGPPANHTWVHPLVNQSKGGPPA